MITEMKMKEILVQEGDDLWELTHIQIQWIAPSIKEELFPEESSTLTKYEMNTTKLYLALVSMYVLHLVFTESMFLIFLNQF
ncbi:hypothetical protein DVH24_029290 [Malus domestica]|uniref:Uncharacterized protein n=1 Tax=Malus domestica TaxID=3750 RepID=A0A498HV90_MALDO|nr:hypothetical protein DVH24_029290 [Malus domestica]